MSGLYFIALIPDEPVLGEVRELKQYCKDHFDSGHALRSPAHVTLYPPFRTDEQGLRNCMDRLEQICQQQSPVTIELDGFDRFRPKVIFIRPQENEELNQLQQDVAAAMNAVLNPKKVDDRPFHPHMTIVFRDLKKGSFHAAWNHFKEMDYQRTWTATDLAVLINGEDGWSVLHKIKFASPIELLT